MLYNHCVVPILSSGNFILQVLSGLISASKLSNDPGKFAESRRDALKSLARYLQSAKYIPETKYPTPNLYWEIFILVGQFIRFRQTNYPYKTAHLSQTDNSSIYSTLVKKKVVTLTEF